MKRDVALSLQDWKVSENRKVLLLRGARQVGKTYSIREFGKTFGNFLEVNLEEHEKVHTFFKGSLTPSVIVEKLSLYFDTKIKPGKTLVFFDEIQACPEALSSLRFFYEKMPELHVVAAGSLLEFALSEIPSFGVGRIESLFMYPMNFSEFLQAMGSGGVADLIKNSSHENPIDSVLHEKCMNLLKVYHLIGGLPEVVKTYINSGNLLASQKIIDGLILTYIDDFAKYKTRSPVDKLNDVFRSVAFQAGGKFKYSNISSERSSTYKVALDLLIKAGLAYKINHSSARGLPLGGQIKENRFKIVLFDIGIYQRLLGLDLSEYVISDYDTLLNRGNLAEIFVCNELIATGVRHIRPEIYYWHRENRGSNAEIDYLISAKGKIVPLEVKAGTKGQMQSIHLFLNERSLSRGIRLSAENFGKYDKIWTIPVYAAGNLWNL